MIGFSGKVSRLIWLLIFLGQLYLSGGWLGADLRTDTQKNMCLKEIGPELNSHFSRFNSQDRFGGGCVLYDHLMTTRIFTLRMDKIPDEHQNYEDIGYGHNLELAIMSR